MIEALPVLPHGCNMHGTCRTLSHAHTVLISVFILETSVGRVAESPGRGGRTR
ncbi:MAG: hypothetical protein RugAbin2_02012 [Rugosibacter sp.]|nr:hypothetical protein [Rugosibacter sp.]